MTCPPAVRDPARRPPAGHGESPRWLAVRRAVILPVVLFVLVLIGLLAAMYSFRVFSDLAASQAMAYRFQTRLAAEAGVEYVKLLLRTSRFDRAIWYSNPDLFNRVIVMAHERDARTAGTTEEFDEEFAFRFSIVADDPTDDKEFTRFGITDEASKLNLNTATQPQLLKLVTGAVGESKEFDPVLIVDAIIDWRDGDSNPNGEQPDTEGDYYRALEKPYGIKNGPFDSVEELLLVKGVTPALLYGEDYDRNGLLSENEKDADRTFPPDNQDEILDRGLYPYLTVVSAENNVGNDNRPRAYLFGEESILRGELEALFPDEPEIVDYVHSAVKAPQGSGQQGGQGGGQQQGGGGSQGQGPGGSGQGGMQGAGQQPKGSESSNKKLSAAGTQPDTPSDGKEEGKTGPQLQRREPSGGNSGSQGAAQGGTGAQGSEPGTPAQQSGEPPSGETPGQQGAEGTEGEGDENSQGEGEEQGDQQQSGEGSGNGGGSQSRIKSPAGLMLPRTVDEQVQPSPLTAEHLAILMDRTTTIEPNQRTIPGLINVNTAPRQVLEAIDGLSPEQIDVILAMRDSLSPEVASTTAWLFSEGVLDATAFDKVAPQITARGQQFTIESVGYADHIGMVTRLQVVVDMNGPIAQTVSYRDISSLGGAYPIREQDKEKMRAR